MIALLATLLTCQLVGQDVALSLQAPSPFPWLTLGKVEFPARYCSASGFRPMPGWRSRVEWRAGEVWYVVERAGLASPIPESFLTFYGCRPYVRQVWLWWDGGGTPYAQCYTVRVEYRGYRPAVPPREVQEQR